MVRLSRTVRFAVNPGAHPWGEPTNTFAAYPSMRGLGRHYELDVVCRGEIDPRLGYFVNIKAVDAAARTVAIPAFERACSDIAAEPTAALRLVLPTLDAALGGRLATLRLRLSPYYSVEMSTADPAVALLRQQFELAAAHRLHIPALSDAENRDLFGKCNNPAGHGHNYRLEPCVEVPLAPGGRPLFSLVDLERATNRAIVDRFDHIHLNHTPQFDVERGGLNPSVENIARVFYDLLAPAIEREAGGRPGVKLRSVTVWETDKTCCTYPG